MPDIWLDGAFAPARTARIDPADRGFLLGDAAFETMRVCDGSIRRWSRHRARLAGALETLRIAAPDWQAIENAAIILRQRQGLEDAMARLTVSRGPFGAGMKAPDLAPGTVLLSVSPRPDAPKPLKLMTIDAPRREPTSLACRFKLCGYADQLQARRLAADAGADMGLMLSSSGAVSCADSASLFWIKENQVFTPSLAAAALPGTGRAALIEAATANGVAVHEGEYGRDSLADIDAAFAVNAGLGAAAVESLDGRALDVENKFLIYMQSLESRAD